MTVMIYSRPSNMPMLSSHFCVVGEADEGANDVS